MESPSDVRPQRADVVKRVSRACLHCRQRKSRCDLYVLPRICTGVIPLISRIVIRMVILASRRASAVCASIASASSAVLIEVDAAFARTKSKISHRRLIHRPVRTRRRPRVLQILVHAVHHLHRLRRYLILDRLSLCRLTPRLQAPRL